MALNTTTGVFQARKCGFLRVEEARSPGAPGEGAPMQGRLSRDRSANVPFPTTSAPRSERPAASVLRAGCRGRLGRGLRFPEAPPPPPALMWVLAAAACAQMLGTW